ncbi:MAG: restriction endonuclease subunit S [Hydrogenophaga sp.]|uniref:restriction endonuclease subunit S n=1 Tax=Hydrogenophaga sp. TaxID=1904254 RepID=UPI001D8CF23D|nr:restriction endonuclease subunit S [Hydrogenophaga sp.]MBX3608568.1 restriction endonuclease subunit S [Hydrogenophaga sp.]
MSAVPTNWTVARLGDVSDVIRGITFPATAKQLSKTANNVCCLRTANVQREVNWADVYFVPREFVKRQDQLVRPGDILMSLANSYELVGKVALAKHVPHETAFGAFLGAVRPRTSIEGQYLFHFLRTPFAQSALRDGSSQTTNIANISVGRLGELRVPLAPRPEQKRIADKLDALLARVDACRDRLERVPTILKRFRQAVLSSAMVGTLTETWRVSQAEDSAGVNLAERLVAQHLAAGGHRVGNAADPTEGVHDLSAESLPAGWGLTTLRDAVDPQRPVTYGILKPGPELSGGIPYVRVADFPNDRLALGGIRRTSPAIDAEFKRSRLRAGDLLLSIRGTVGRLVEIPQELEGANITQDTARLAIQPMLNRSFVLWYLRSEHAQSRMRRAVKGVAVRGINIGDVRALQLPVPSRAEQDEIVRCIESLFDLADSMEVRFQTARSCVERLTPALLEKAFRGGLVPQDPSDEPASKLLERIGLETPARVPGRRRMPPSRSTDLKPAIEGNLLDIISHLPKAGFTFDELRQASSADYESLKERLFALLADADSGVEQFFDTDAKSMKLRRVRK